MEKDYIHAHLNWISKHKHFVPKYHTDMTGQFTYYEIMHYLYSNPAMTQKIAEGFYYADLCWEQETNEIAKSLQLKVFKDRGVPTNWFFVTIGFNHQTYTIDKCKKVIEKVLGMEWVIKAKANFEMYRENGEHPHVHFLLETYESKSDVLYKLWRPQYVKNVVLSKNFVDVKVAEFPRHNKYINLEKTESKTCCIERDRLFRENNGIPDYEKNWNPI